MANTITTKAHQDAFDWAAAQRILSEAASGADDAEIFLEDARSEAIAWDDGRLSRASFDTQQGFGLRIVGDEMAGYGHSSSLEPRDIQRAADAAALAKAGRSGVLDVSPARANRALYDDIDPMLAPEFSAKANLLSEIDAYLRAQDREVVQVSVSLRGERQAISILRPDGERFSDVRPLVVLNVSATLERNGRRESGFWAWGGRESYERFIDAKAWKEAADEALRIARVNLESVPAPAGEMDVVLGPGWPGVLFHEAVGHGLEGDFNRKGLSVYSGKVGERVAAPGVTIVDDGTIESRRGSLTFDDEGTPTRRNVLIEDGILVGYMQDRMNARLSGLQSTGNGRRQSYAHMPMPRMTNTFLEAGPHHPDEIIKRLKRGIYAANLGGGQVDIVNGKFVFQCVEAYLVEDGEIKAPIKGATLIGDGPRVIQNVTMVGNNFQLDRGIGTCGKNGQAVPVGLGQPTLYIKGLTVGGAN